MFYFYRTQSIGMVATNDWRGQVNWYVPWGSQSDTIYVMVALTAPATLTISTGGTISTYDLAGGINHVEAPFSTGAQSFALSLNGIPINSLNGEPILTFGELYNHWMTTGFVETAP